MSSLATHSTASAEDFHYGRLYAADDGTSHDHRIVDTRTLDREGRTRSADSNERIAQHIANLLDPYQMLSGDRLSLVISAEEEGGDERQDSSFTNATLPGHMLSPSLCPRILSLRYIDGQWGLGNHTICAPPDHKLRCDTLILSTLVPYASYDASMLEEGATATIKAHHVVQILQGAERSTAANEDDRNMLIDYIGPLGPRDISLICRSQATLEEAEGYFRDLLDEITHQHTGQNLSLVIDTGITNTTEQVGDAIFERTKAALKLPLPNPGGVAQGKWEVRSVDKDERYDEVLQVHDETSRYITDHYGDIAI